MSEPTRAAIEGAIDKLFDIFEADQGFSNSNNSFDLLETVQFMGAKNPGNEPILRKLLLRCEAFHRQTSREAGAHSHMFSMVNRIRR